MLFYDQNLNHYINNSNQEVRMRNRTNSYFDYYLTCNIWMLVTHLISVLYGVHEYQIDIEFTITVLSSFEIEIISCFVFLLVWYHSVKRRVFNIFDSK